jgi:hypothetical protein
VPISRPAVRPYGIATTIAVVVAAANRTALEVAIDRAVVFTG